MAKTSITFTDLGNGRYVSSNAISVTGDFYLHVEPKGECMISAMQRPTGESGLSYTPSFGFRSTQGFGGVIKNESPVGLDIKIEIRYEFKTAAVTPVAYYDEG